MKKLIASLMLVLSFVNVASAVKGVEPDAKTLALLKDAGKEHSSIIEKIVRNDGFRVREDGGKRGFIFGYSPWLSFDKYEKIEYLSTYITSKEGETVYDLWWNTVSGTLSGFTIRNTDGEYILVNEYRAYYNPDGSIDYIVDPKGNIV